MSNCGMMLVQQQARRSLLWQADSWMAGAVDSAGGNHSLGVKALSNGQTIQTADERVTPDQYLTLSAPRRAKLVF